MKNKTIHIQGKDITINTSNTGDDYISLTDIARFKNPREPKDIVKNWMRTRSSIEFLGIWEKINNPKFKGVEFDSFKQEAGSNSFVLSPQIWIEKTGAIGIRSKSGNKGGTFAHKDIAFEFATWISPEFKLYLIKEFQRLKVEENDRLSLDWTAKRMLTKINYKIHTDSIKENIIIPQEIDIKTANLIYASEADVLNKALFGITAQEWINKNREIEGNIRDYADVYQLVCLSNLESINALLISQNIFQNERLLLLNKTAIMQMKSLLNNSSVKKLDT